MFSHYLILLGGCGPSGTGPTSSSSGSTNPYVALPGVVAALLAVLLVFGLIAVVLSQRGSFTPASRRWIRWPYIVASALALLGIAWSWQLSSTYNDGGCVVILQSWPVDSDSSSISLVISILLLGILAAIVAYLVLDVTLVIRSLRERRVSH